MQGSLKNKLSQYEAVPPTNTWEKIALQLDEEMLAGDIDIAVKMVDASMEPPAGAWKNIEAMLDNPHYSPTAKVVPMYRKTAVAIAIATIIAFAGFYYYNANPEINGKMIVDNATIPESQPSLAGTDDDIDSADRLENAARRTTQEILQKRATPRKLAARPQKVPTSPQLNYTDIDIDDPKPVQMVSALGPVQVAAPPIRDASGDVIMDLSVISNPNEPYITVTSPNGSQTKISNKFLSCLSYLNGHYTASEINYEGQQWKSRFAEWRNKLTEAGFVPGANNFFDIFELQELIRD